MIYNRRLCDARSMVFMMRGSESQPGTRMSYISHQEDSHAPNPSDAAHSRPASIPVTWKNVNDSGGEASFNNERYPLQVLVQF